MVGFTMKSDTVFFVIILLAMIVDFILFVFFGQKTVRKLRKNPATKDFLGIEPISGWDIFHVANALALPMWLTRKVRQSKLTAFFADADILEKLATRFDVVLAKIFLGLLLSWTSAILVLMFLDKSTN
jgi:hypothetical protein